MAVYFSSNLTSFLERINPIISKERIALEQLASEASARCNAHKCKMLKASIADVLVTDYQYRKSVLEYSQAIGKVVSFQTAVDKYLTYITAPENDRIRRFIDEDLPTLDSVEKFIKLVNQAHLDYMFDTYEFPCTCGTTSETFENCLYPNYSRNNHSIVPCKGKCTFGTDMTMDDASALLDQPNFIEYGTEFHITFSKA